MADVRCVPFLFAGLLERWGQKGPAEIAPKRRFTYRYFVWAGDAARALAESASGASVQSAETACGSRSRSMRGAMRCSTSSVSYGAMA